MFRSFLSPVIKLMELPNLLSLDAPLVAIAWQWLLWHSFIPVSQPLETARIPGLLPPMHATGLLFAAVWLIYMSDRLLDSRKLDFSKLVPRRHQFADRWAMQLWMLWLSVAILTIFIAVNSAGFLLWRAGGGLLSVVAIYSIAAHGSECIRQWLPKEFIVGTIFALGVSLPTVLKTPKVIMLPCIAWLSGLFVLNCLIVAKIQETSDRQQGIGSAITLIPQIKKWLSPLLLIYSTSCILAMIIHLLPIPLATAMCISGFGLYFFNRVLPTSILSPKSGRQNQQKSYLADYLLLSPFIVLAFIW